MSGKLIIHIGTTLIVLSLIHIYLKRYTACQVAYIAPPDTVSKESWAVILSLDWVGDAPLTVEELPHLHPLYKDFMYLSLIHI